MSEVNGRVNSSFGMSLARKCTAPTIDMDDTNMEGGFWRHRHLQALRGNDMLQQISAVTC